MRRSGPTAFVVLAVFLGLARGADDEARARIIAQAKRATAMVESLAANRQAAASAFCVGKEGYFVTARHAIPSTNRIKLVVHSGEPLERVLDARLVRADEKNDLALVKVETVLELTALELADMDNPIETQEVMALGYLLGRGGALRDQYPSVRVQLGRVSGLQKDKGRLQAIILDAKLSSGMSGGPVLDDKGRVIGMVRFGWENVELGGAVLPGESLRKLLFAPCIDFNPDAIPAHEAHKPRELKIWLDTLKPVQGTIDVEMELGDPPRRFAATKQQNDYYTVSVIPLPKPDRHELQVVVEFEGGALTGRITDRTVRIGTASVKLSQIKRIEHRDGKIVLKIADVQRTGAEEIDVKSSPLESIPVSLGEAEVTVNLLKARRVTIEELAPRPASIAYRVVVSQDNKPVAEKRGSLLLDSSVAATQPVCDPAATLPSVKDLHPATGTHPPRSP